jgi:Tol biopolymer transport system component
VDNAAGDIWTVPAAGGPVRRVTATGRAAMPCWSPAGDYIAYFGPAPGQRKGPYQLRYVTPDGSRGGVISAAPGGGGAPDWGPGGEWLVTDIWMGWSPKDVWLVSAKDGEKRRVTAEPDPGGAILAGAANPCWADDGTAVFFESDRRLTDNVYYGVYRISVIKK